ncbi:MAG: hypothetical protein KAS72_03810 [Phycisphaerales bacterium]|nr:hypothetical protein [Phycisphaerales bacterium]
MAKKGKPIRDFATRALKKVGIGLLGKIPVAGVVLKAMVETALEEAAARSPNKTELAARFAEMTAERAIENVEEMRQVLLDLAGEAPDDREEIEKLAEAVADPKGLQKNERFRAAMERLFKKVGKETDDLDELAKAIEIHIHVSADGVIGHAEQRVERGPGFQGGAHEHHHHYGDSGPPEQTTTDVDGQRIEVSSLPRTGDFVLGRDSHLGNLTRAWNADSHNIVVFVAEGGVGKTALVKRWHARMAKRDFRGAACVYDHSFYSQGTSDQTASAESFIREALKWFGDDDPEQGEAWAKGARLAKLAAGQRTLLILDGIEPLQDPDGGHILDPGLRALVLGLADQNGGLCVITTRKKITDLAHHEGGTVKSVDLTNLTKETGGLLLEKLGVDGTKEEREKASDEFGNHALTITLLGTFLARAHEGDIRKRSEIDLAAADMNVPHKEHARKVMASYEKWLRDTDHAIEIAILRTIGLFTRPADGGSIRALREGPAIADLTDGVVGIDQVNWNLAVTTLRDLRLLALEDERNPEGLDAHPLVREHFADRLRTEYPEAWRAGHERLYEHLTSKEGCAKEYPDTIEEMQPLFAAVVHGCHAGRHQDAFREVFRRRIQRGQEFYSTTKLGAVGAELGALTGFFEELWMRPVETIVKRERSFVLNEAASRLRALGRLAEAAAPMRAGLEIRINDEDWENAARVAGNLSELHLSLGEVEEAIERGERAVEYADRSGDAFQKMGMRTTLADALHHGGRIEEAEGLFREAESMQAERQKPYPLLYSVQGFRYCALLLGKGEYSAVIERATQTLEWATQHRFLLDIALDHLSLGRAFLAEACVEDAAELIDKARMHISEAVDGLREARTLHHMPRGLLGRAELCTFTGEHAEARAALDEAMNIAKRDPKGRMRLHITDCHLAYARLALAEGGSGADEARTHLAEARRLIEETGYHRRDGELDELDARAG